MANPTTNYGWPMPTATDLVTDLPADFAAFGQPVDTSLKALNPETTLGDIAYRSATSNTNTRLGIGSTGNVLTVSGGVPVWSAPSSGSMTLLSTTSLSGASTTISSISGSYKNLYVEVKDFIPSSGNETVRLRVNGDSGSVYNSIGMGGGGDIGNTSATNANFAADVRTTGTASHNTGFIDFPDYANTTNYKQWNNWAWFDNANAGYWGFTCYSSYYKGTIAAISSITFLVTAGNLTGTVKVYGVN